MTTGQPDPFLSQEHIQVATAFLAGFQHEWLQGAQVKALMEDASVRAFAANFAQAYSKWYEKETIEAQDAKRFLSCLAVGTAAALQLALAQQSPDS